ncbi:MAG: DUF3078 domain-containing protein [Acidobacteriota bacterium]
MKFFFTAILILLFLHAPAFTEKKTDDKKKSKKELKLLFSSTQSSFSNWQRGGSNSLAFSSSLEGSFRKISGRKDRDHEIELGIGILKQEGTNLRKTEDLIHYSFASGYTFREGGKWALFLDLSLRTQFTSGYNYEKNPFKEVKELPVKVSNILSPLYMAQSISFTFRKDKWFRSSLGLGMKQVYVGRPELRELYGLSDDIGIKFEAGISSKLEFEKEIFKNVKADSEFDLFFSVTPVKNPDIRWNNKVDVKINSWLQMRVEFEMFYDEDIIDKVQIREVFSLGLIINILK